MIGPTFSYLSVYPSSIYIRQARIAAKILPSLGISRLSNERSPCVSATNTQTHIQRNALTLCSRRACHREDRDPTDQHSHRPWYQVRRRRRKSSRRSSGKRFSPRTHSLPRLRRHPRRPRAFSRVLSRRSSGPLFRRDPSLYFRRSGEHKSSSASCAIYVYSSR